MITWHTVNIEERLRGVIDEYPATDGTNFKHLQGYAINKDGARRKWKKKEVVKH